MADGLRVLYVDDEPELLELAKIFLEKSGEFQVGISSSATEVLDIPIAQSYDAIVSDYEMPEMNGIAFLKHVRKQVGDIPFILFTGRGREEVVIDAINNGADFYLQKGGSAQAQFAELAHKIRQAVEKRRAQAELRDAYNRITESEEELARSEQQLQESENKFRDFADHLPQMVFETDMDLTITYVNKYTIVTYGFPIEVLGSGMSILTFIHPSQHAMFMESVQHLRYGIPFEPREYTAFNKEGQPFPVIVYSSPIFRNKQMVGFRGVVTDISARKQAETALRESEEKHRTFAELLPQTVFEIDLSDRLTLVNQQAYTMFMVSPEDVAAGFNALSVIDPSQHARLRKNMESLVHGESYTNEEYTLIRKDGTTFPGLIYSNPIYRGGQLAGFRGIIIDISRQKQTEAALRESEEKHRTFAELLPQIVFEVDSDFRLTFVNNQAYAQLGFTPEEVAKGVASSLSVIDPSQHARLKENVKKIARGEPVTHEEYTYIRKDGSTFPALLYADPVYKNGTLTGFRGIVLDISERKEAEAALRESEEKFRLLVEVNQDIVFSLDKDGTVLYVSPQARDQLGFRPDEITGKPFTEFIHPEDAPRILHNMEKNVLFGSPPMSEQFRVLCRDGTYRWYEDKTIYASDRNSRRLAIGTIRDITERKAADEALFSSRQMLQTVLDTIPQRVFWKDRDSRYLGGNQHFAADVGFSDPSDVVGKTDHDHSSSAFAAHFQEDDREVIESGQPKVNIEEPLILKDGIKVWLRTTKVPLRNQDGEIIGVLGSYDNITEQKTAQEALVESETRFRDLTDRLPQMVFETDRELRITYANRHAALVSGFSVEELTAGKPVLTLIKPAQHARFIESVKNILANIPFEPKEYTAIRKDGSTIPVIVYSSPIFRNKEITGFRGIAVDISDWKKMEAEIRESEEKFRSLVENASDIVFSLDRAGNFTYISPQWEDILGHDPKTLIGTGAAALIHPDDVAGNIKAFRSAMEEGNRIRGFEYRIRHKNGSWRWHSQSAAPLKNASGRIVAYQGICHDITKGKTAEKALRESEAHYRLLADNVKDVIWTADKEMHLTYVSPSMMVLRGLSPDEAIAEPIEHALTPESLALLREHYHRAKEALENGEKMPEHPPLELEFVRKDGSTVWTEVIISPTSASDGTPTGVVGITRDISQRKASEQAVRESEKMFSTIFRNSQIALTLLSVKDNRFFDVNDAFTSNTGFSRDDVLGKTPWDISLLVDKAEELRVASILREQQHLDPMEVKFRVKDGSIQTCLYAATLITMGGDRYILSSVIDITERKNAEEALRQANRKLNILSGITRHDINNQLQALGSYVELLRHSVPGDSHDNHFFRIGTTIEQITSLIQFTREYEMIGVHEPVWQDVRTLVLSAGKAALPDTIHLVCDLPDQLEIYADPLISKVFFNLLDNAKRHGGKIRQVRFLLEEMNGDRIIVCTDDGDGVPASEKERIFEPGIGKNTGFGLAISREILDITGITIRETGKMGNGARFEITVPAGKYRNTS
jgi:PAS domain S-box-containing protein